jgi:spore maturation protein CgeB
VKVLLVHPGATWAVHDVWRGFYEALSRREDVEVVQYALDGRIGFAGSWLHLLHRRNKANGMPKPTQADILYLAAQGILERALRFDVDWVLVVAGTYIMPDTYDLMRKAGLKVAVVLTESPYDMRQEVEVAKRVSVVFTNERTAVPAFGAHCRAYYYQHAHDPARHRPAEADVAAHDVVFVGTGWEERCELLGAMDWTGIDLGLYGSWGLLGSRHPLRRHLCGGVIGNDVTAALYGRAKIGLNLHRTALGWGRGVEHVSGAESMNPRCYELAACGRFFITDHRAEVGEVFGDVVPTFETPLEAEALIRHYLARDSEREAVAAQLPGLVAYHTFDARVNDVIAVLKEI